jgi:fluoroacetyl-CoA thioesterase
MKNVYKPGDKKHFRRMIAASDVAAFDGNVVHHVYATFSLARDAEWSSRLFVLDMKEDDEEGIGTFLNVEHKAAAFVGEEINFTTWIDRIEGNELICFFEARVNDRIIAVGKTGQKILPIEKLKTILSPSSKS